MMKKINVDVVILSWAKTDFLKNITINCVETLKKSEDNINFNIFLLESDNKVKYNFPYKIELIYMNDTFGYHKFMNIGRKMGKSDYVSLCNNDLRFEKKWASNIINEMINDKELLSASSFEPNITKKYNFKKNVNYGYITRKHLNGWCIFQKRKIYDIIGDLDEKFDFWCCDDDYGMVLKNNNIKHALIKNSIVYHDHNGGKTLRSLNIENTLKYTSGGIKKFMEKYNHKPLYMI